jgi:protein-tyrosine phosphatase
VTAAPLWLELEGAVNARDVGGLPTVDGRTTRPGVLLRADNLQDLTARDVSRLTGPLRLRTVVDLRSTGEAHLAGPTPLQAAGGVEHHQLSLIPEWDGEPDAVEVERAVQRAIVDGEPPAGEPAGNASLDDGSPAGAGAGAGGLPGSAAAADLPALSDFEARARRRRDPTDLTEHYVGYVEQAGPNLARALRLLAEPADGTTLVHCAAGKDRTGVVVALALSLAGVVREAVVEDYLRSAERADRILTRLRTSPVYGPSLADVQVADITPQAASMERFLEWVDRVYSGPHGLAMSLAVPEETVARLCTRLVGTSALAR